MKRPTGLAARGDRAGLVARPLVVALIAAGVVSPTTAATINVTTGGDTSSMSSCTLRDAIASINGAALLNGCSIASGLFGTDDTVDLTGQAGTIGLTGGTLMPTAPVRLQGPGASTLTISGLGAVRLIDTTADLAIDGLTIANGNANGPGGCILANDLSLSNSVVTGCTSTSHPEFGLFLNGLGGGVAAKYLNAYRVSILGNTASTAGGGAFVYAGVFTESLISGNTVNATHCDTPDDESCAPAFLGGGGILGGTVLTLGSTISGNTVNASRVTKYDGGAETTYQVNVGLGGGISQFPIGLYTETSFAAKAGGKRIGSAMFGADARQRVGSARAAIRAKTATVRNGGATTKADGFVNDGLGIAFSTVSGNRVTGDRQADAKYAGGGAFSIAIYDNAEVANSTISGNRLDAPNGAYGYGGALFAASVDLTSDTITGNAGSIAVATALPVLGPPGGAAAAKRGTAFAKAWSRWQAKHPGPRTKAATGRMKDLAPPVFDSTIIANNTGLYDVACALGCTIGGSNNLIRTVADGVTVPSDTLTSNPQLAPLAYNGGILAGAPGHPATLPMPTHLLFVGSPAIDKGSNPEGFEFDQRGPGFPRVVGAAPDIGAIEGVSFNVPNVPVPALGPWLLALLSGLLGALGLRSRRRR